MEFTFKKAERKRAKVRVGFTGPSGAGKTYSAILYTRGLVGPNGKIVFIDTEHGSGELYSHLTEYDYACLTPPYRVEDYIAAIRAAEDNGYDAIIIDSLSHAWAGSGGLLEQLDVVTASSRSGNSFQAWGKITPQHNKLIEAMLGSKIHIITTMRSKTDYLQMENEKGKLAPQKVGLAPVQREGMEYEFTIVFDIDISHLAVSSKDRTGGLFDGKIFKISEETGNITRNWLEQASDVNQDVTVIKAEVPITPAPEANPRPKNLYDAKQIEGLKATYKKNGWSDVIIGKAKLEGEEFWDRDVIDADWRARRDATEQTKPAGEVCPLCKKNTPMTADEMEVFDSNCETMDVQNIQHGLCIECATAELAKKTNKEEKPEEKKIEPPLLCEMCNKKFRDEKIEDTLKHHGIDKMVCPDCIKKIVHERSMEKKAAEAVAKTTEPEPVDETLPKCEVEGCNNRIDADTEICLTATKTDKRLCKDHLQQHLAERTKQAKEKVDAEIAETKISETDRQHVCITCNSPMTEEEANEASKQYGKCICYICADNEAALKTIKENKGEPQTSVFTCANCGIEVTKVQRDVSNLFLKKTLCKPCMSEIGGDQK